MWFAGGGLACAGGVRKMTVPTQRDGAVKQAGMALRSGAIAVVLAVKAMKNRAG